MSKAIRDHLRDFVAIIGLVVVALRRDLGDRPEPAPADPGLEEKSVRAQGRAPDRPGGHPGQGQTVRVAGVRVGDISDVAYEDGNAW